MGPIRSGNLAVTTTIRDAIAAADTDNPNTTNPATPARAPVVGRSKDAWVIVRNVTPTGAPSVTISMYGSATGAAGSWRAIGQLNSGAPITAGTREALTIANRVFYAEAFAGLLGWPYLWATMTGTPNSTVTVEAVSETA